MTVITTRITVTSEGAVSAATRLPAGEYEAALTAAGGPVPAKPFTMEGFPTHDLGWDYSISLHREDMYGDDGR